jgi:hypothetical protein
LTQLFLFIIINQHKSPEILEQNERANPVQPFFHPLLHHDLAKASKHDQPVADAGKKIEGGHTLNFFALSQLG